MKTKGQQKGQAKIETQLKNIPRINLLVLRMIQLIKAFN